MMKGEEWVEEPDIYRVAQPRRLALQDPVLIGSTLLWKVLLHGSEATIPVISCALRGATGMFE